MRIFIINDLSIIYIVYKICVIFSYIMCIKIKKSLYVKNEINLIKEVNNSHNAFYK